MTDNILILHTMSGISQVVVKDSSDVNTVGDRLALGGGCALIEYFENGQPKKRWIVGQPGEFFVQITITANTWVTDRSKKL